MKKFLICIMMMLSIVNANAEENAKMNVEAYHIQCNTSSLIKTLGATSDQAEAISDVMDLFDMQTATIVTEDNDNVRTNMMMSAVNDNVRLMKGILTKEQSAVYLRILNATLSNRNVLH